MDTGILKSLRSSVLSRPLSVAVLAEYVMLFIVMGLTGFCWTYRNRGIFASSSRNLKVIPSPKGGKMFKGNLRDLQTGGASAEAWFKLYKQYGPVFELTVPFFRLHVINHPVYLEHIQKHNHKNYVRGKFNRNVFGALHRTGIFVVDGNDWYFQRKAATRAFSKNNFETHITQSVHMWLDILLRLLSNLAKEGKEFDFQEVMGRFVFCLFLRIAFHEDKLALEVLSEDPKSLESMPDYIQAFDQAGPLFDRRRRDPLWKITEKLSGEDKLSKQAVNLFYAKTDGLIKQRLEKMKNGYKPDPDAGVDLLDLFLQSTTDLYTLGGMVFAFLTAGRDTTAFSISWLVKEIYHQKNRHIDAASKMRAEAAEAGFSDSYLSYAAAPKLKFTNAMWDESQRLNTVCATSQMEAAGDDILPAVPELNMPPRYIKKGDIVSYQNYVLSRMPEVWGEDASVFNPSRWFQENGDSISYSPFKFHSWNAGPRSCLGRALATFEGITTITAILQRFDIILSDDTKLYEPLSALNMGIRDGLKVRVKERVPEA